MIRQILEYYFLQICGYDGENLRQQILVNNKHKFIDTVDDGLHLTEDCEDAVVYKETFKLIFEVLNQEQHYDMMMAINNGIGDLK